MSSFLHKHIIGTSICFLLLVFAACKPKNKEPDLSQIVFSLKESGQLITAEYTLSKIIRASDNQTWYKLGDRKLLMRCEAYMKAGVDLQNINTNNFVVVQDSIALTLPHSQFFSLNIPADKIQLAYQEVGPLRDPFSAAEREQLLAQAEPQIKALTTSLGILKTADNNAVTYMQRLLQQAGYKHVSVSFK